MFGNNEEQKHKKSQLPHEIPSISDIENSDLPPVGPLPPISALNSSKTLLSPYKCHSENTDLKPVENKLYKCPNCEIIFRHVKSVRRHIREKHEQKPRAPKPPRPIQKSIFLVL